MKKLSLFFITALTAAAVIAPVLTMPVFASFVNDVKCSDAKNCIPDPSQPGDCTQSNCDLVAKYLNPFIKFLGIALGLAATIGIAVGGVEYSSSGGDPQKAARGKRHIVVAIIALVGYLFLYAGLTFLNAGSF